MANRRLLLISNGHGEDLNASIIAQAIHSISPTIKLAAMPLVGEGNAYRRAGIEVVCPTRTLPSGGFVYMDWRQAWQDVTHGLVGLTWQHLRLIRQFAHDRAFDLVLAVGDIVPIFFAYLSDRPFIAYLVSTSAHYENKLILPMSARLMLEGKRCLGIFARDKYTAQLLLARGFSNASFQGYPIMDVLEPQGKSLLLKPDQPLICLLCGSRLPEAKSNLTLLLRLVNHAQELALNWQFRSPIVPSLGGTVLQATAQEAGWHYHQQEGWQILTHPDTHAQVWCADDAFADILERADVVVGMSGTAIEQAVGLGKPVVQVVGAGPQFTHRFADAQQRLLGESVQTHSNPESAVTAVRHSLDNQDYRDRCRQNGRERVGGKGGAAKIAHAIITQLNTI